MTKLKSSLSCIFISLSMIHAPISGSAHASQVKDVAKQAYLDGTFNGIYREESIGRRMGSLSLFGASLGTLVIASGGYGLDSSERVAWGVVSGASLGLGLSLFFWLQSEEERVAQEYLSLPSSSGIEMKKKIALGESKLASLAEKHSRQRYIGSVGSFIAGGIFLGLGIGSDTSSTTSRNIWLYAGTFMLAWGFVPLFVKSPIEKDYADYVKFRESLDADRASGIQYVPSLVASRDGRGYGLGITLGF